MPRQGLRARKNGRNRFGLGPGRLRRMEVIRRRTSHSIDNDYTLTPRIDSGRVRLKGQRKRFACVRRAGGRQGDSRGALLTRPCWVGEGEGCARASRRSGGHGQPWRGQADGRVFCPSREKRGGAREERMCDLARTFKPNVKTCQPYFVGHIAGGPRKSPCILFHNTASALGVSARIRKTLRGAPKSAEKGRRTSPPWALEPSMFLLAACRCTSSPSSDYTS